HRAHPALAEQALDLVLALDPITNLQAHGSLLIPPERLSADRGPELQICHAFRRGAMGRRSALWARSAYISALRIQRGSSVLPGVRGCVLRRCEPHRVSSALALARARDFEAPFAGRSQVRHESN